MVHVESRLIEQRINSEERSRVLMLQMAVSSLFNKKAQGAFKKMMKDLDTP